MTNQEKHELVSGYLAQHAEQSDRQIAKALGVSPSTVGKVRAYLVSKRRLTAVEARQGADGKKRKKRRTKDEIEFDAALADGMDKERKAHRHQQEKQKQDRKRRSELQGALKHLENLIARMVALSKKVPRAWEQERDEIKSQLNALSA